MPAPSEFVNMAVGTLVGKAPAQAVTARTAVTEAVAMPRRPKLPMALPPGAPVLRDERVPGSAMDGEIAGMFGTVQRPRAERPQAAVVEYRESTFADFEEAALNENATAENIAKEVQENAEDLRDAFANPQAEPPLEAGKIIEDFKKEAEAESLEALEKILKGLK